MAIMHLVGVQNDGLPSGAIGAGTAIVEGLHTVQSVTDGIEVVPMRVVGMPCKERFDSLQARLRWSEPDPITR